MRLTRPIIQTSLLVGGLSAWYATHPDQSPSVPFEQKYDLPEKIPVKNAQGFPITCTQIGTNEERTYQNPQEALLLMRSGHCWAQTNDINWNNNFSIQTDRYKVIKGDDYGLSQNVGKVLSLGLKLYFWDRDIGKGLDEERTKAVLAMLENDPNIKDLTVRLNHNAVFEDLKRLFKDPNVTERNSLFGRIFLGGIVGFFNELFAELARRDYYNPMTQTTVIYSNVEAIAAHEMGHHLDYQRFSSDWEYTVISANLAIMAWKEWRATQYASDIGGTPLIDQYDRYLLPALLTYLLALGAVARPRLIRDTANVIYKNSVSDNASEATKAELKKEASRIAEQVVGIADEIRRTVVMILMGTAGFSSFCATYGVTESEVIGFVAYIAASAATGQCAAAVLSRVLPYYFENPSRWQTRKESFHI